MPGGPLASATCWCVSIKVRAVPTCTRSLLSDPAVKIIRIDQRCQAQGFSFQRISPGLDPPVLGVRKGIDYRDTVYLAEFGERCYVMSPPLEPDRAGRLPVTNRAGGDALTVLHTAVSGWGA